MLPVLAHADLALAATTLSTTAEIAAEAASKADSAPASAKGTIAAAHARAAAVMLLITCHGSLLQSEASLPASPMHTGTSAEAEILRDQESSMPADLKAGTSRPATDQHVTETGRQESGATSAQDRAAAGAGSHPTAQQHTAPERETPEHGSANGNIPEPSGSHAAAPEAPASAVAEGTARQATPNIQGEQESSRAASRAELAHARGRCLLVRFHPSQVGCVPHEKLCFIAGTLQALCGPGQDLCYLVLHTRLRQGCSALLASPPFAKLHSVVPK